MKTIEDLTASTTAEASPSSAAAAGGGRRRIHIGAPRGRRAVLAALFVAVLAAAGAGYSTLVGSTPAQSFDSPAATGATGAATAGTIALLSYNSETVDADLQQANTLLTGEFAEYYGNFTRDVVSPAAKERHIATEAVVVGTALTELSADHAITLVMVNQTTTTADNPDPSTTSTSVRVALDRVDGSWLISAFDPV